MGRTIGICNHKGGVGKTTTAVAMARCLTDLGYRVLLVDLDDSGNPSLSKNLGVEANIEEGEPNLIDVLDPILKGRPLNRKVLHDSIVQHNEGYFVLPSDKSLSGLSISIISSVAKDKTTILKTALEPLKELFDYIILDAAPSLTLLQTNLMAACDDVIIVTQPQGASVDGIAEMIETLSEIKKQISPDLRMVGVLVVMYDGRTNYNKDKTAIIVEQLREQGVPVFNTIIPRSTVAESWVEAHTSLVGYKPNSKPSVAYREFTKEYLSLGGK